MSVHISGSFINLSPFCFFILPWQVPTLQALFLGLRLRPISVSVPYVGSPCFHQEIPNPQADSTLLSRFRHWGTIHQPERQLMFTHRPLIYHSLPGNIGGIYWGFFWKWLFFFYKFPKIRFLVTCWSSTKTGAAGRPAGPVSGPTHSLHSKYSHAPQRGGEGSLLMCVPRTTL